MTDTSLPPPDGDDRGEVEARLRATLAAVASEPVDDDLDALRRRADADGSRRDRPTRIGPHRSRALAAAAVLLTLVAAAAVVIASRGDDDPGEGVATGAPEATGWYLPEGLGTEWDLVGISATPAYAQPSVARQVRFVTTPSSTQDRSIDVQVLAVDPAMSVPPGMEALELGAPAPFPVFTPVDAASSAEGPVGSVAVIRGDRLLLISDDATAARDLIPMARRWWESGGRDISVEPGSGLVRLKDFTYAAPRPPAAGVGPVAGARTLEGAGSIVAVTVRRRGAAIDTTYGTRPTGRGARPTGVGLADRGAALGLAPEERPERVDVPGAPGGVWRIGDDPRLRETGSEPTLYALFPGAEVTILGGLVGPWDGEPSPGELQQLKVDLAAALRLVSAEEWADAVRSVEDDPDPALLSPTLAQVPLSERTDGATTTTTDPGSTPGSGPTDAPTTTAGSGPTPGPAVDAEAATAALTLIDFARDPSDATFAELPLADSVELGLEGTGGEAPRTEGRGALRDPERWAIELTGALVGTTSALDLLAQSGPPSIESPADPHPMCAVAPDPATSDPHVAVITPAQTDSCFDWFAVVLHLADGPVVEVDVVLREP